MKQFLKLFTENITILLVSIYGLGLIYYKLFYNHYGIKIESYIQLNDILFFTLLTLSKVIVLILFVEILVAGLWSITAIFAYRRFVNLRIRAKYGNATPLNVKDRYYRRNIVRPYYGFSTLVSIPILYFAQDYAMEFFEISMMTYFMLYSFIVIIVKGVVAATLTGYTRAKHKITIIAMYFLLSGFIMSAITDANNNIEIITNTNITYINFNYNDLKYSTQGSQYSYIGETTDYLFIFDRLAEEALIFKKDDLKNIRIIDNRRLSERQDRYNYYSLAIAANINVKYFTAKSHLRQAVNND